MFLPVLKIEMVNDMYILSIQFDFWMRNVRSVYKWEMPMLRFCNF
jgi:hypothetical protein